MNHWLFFLLPGLIIPETVIALGVSFYLPYRLSYRTDQFFKAYPDAEKFAALKRQLDPGELFTSQFSHFIFPSNGSNVI